MRFLLLLVVLDLIHPTHCDFSSWIQTILSLESPMETPPPPPTTMDEDVSSWINNIWSHESPVEEPPPPPPPTMVEEFLYWISNILYYPVPPAHRRTRERCIGNNPSESTGPREKPSIIQKVYTWISTKVFGEPPPPAVPIGCTVTLQDRVLSGLIFGLLIAPIWALVLLAAWLAHEENLISERENSSDVDNLQPDLEAEQDPLRAADVPEPSPLPDTAKDVNVPEPSPLPDTAKDVDVPEPFPLPDTAKDVNVPEPSPLPDTAKDQQNAECLKVPEASTSGEPEPSRPKKTALKAPTRRGTIISFKHTSVKVQIRLRPPKHRVTERRQTHPANLSPARRISRCLGQFLRFFWCCAEQEEN
ncbi:synaptic defective enhancer 1-like [Dendropsophus ebraccatus]|uniref:synaptic defective enhancer 1-like n=1 Tax=Dendropsophus ebraccatus TaxID=150705 RepID=UPI003831AD2D